MSIPLSCQSIRELGPLKRFGVISVKLRKSFQNSCEREHINALMETHGSPSSNWTGLCAPVGVAGRGVVETRPTVFTELVVLGVTGTELVDELVTVGVSVVLVGVCWCVCCVLVVCLLC